MLTPLKLPPGYYQNGTLYQAKGRWAGGTLVRFHEGAIKPVGGWQEVIASEDTSTTITLSGTCRALIGWTGNDASQALAAGTNTKAYVLLLGHLHDITPAGFTTGNVDPSYGTGGYGSGTYSNYLYGINDPQQETLVQPAVWRFDTFGQELVACCAPNDGKLYSWDYNTGHVLTLMSAAPTGCVGVVVTPERFVVALGSGGVARHLDWSAQEDFTNWTPGGAVATGTLTSDATAPSSGDTVTVGSKTYTFRSVFVGIDGEVQIGGSAANALANLKSAVNLTGSAGTDYGILTTQNAQVTATTLTSTTLVFEALTVGTAGNTIASTETSAHLSFGGTTLSGGLDDGGAGGFDLEGVGTIVTGKRGKGETIIFTTDEVHAMRYISGTLVYGFEKLGTKCGLIAPGAVAQIGTQFVWMGTKQFYMYDGFVKPVPSDVSDFVFSDFNADAAGKVTASTFAQFNEVWWYYPSASSTENNRYVVWNYAENHWTTGGLTRTAACDAGALRYPTQAGVGGKLYQHESGQAMTDSVNPVSGVTGSFTYAPSIYSGPIELGDGDSVMYVSQIIPDEKSIRTATGNTEIGDTQLSIYGSFYPGEAESLNGPYSTAKLTDARFTARWVRLLIEQVNAVSWRVGTIRLDVTPAGRR